MTNLITDVARYVMIFLIAFYTYLNFRYFSLDMRNGRTACVEDKNRIMVLIQILAYGVMYLRTEDIRLPLFAAVQIVFFLWHISCCIVFFIRMFPGILVNNVCMFLSIGLFMLSRLSFEKAERQFVIVAAAAVITWIIPFIIDRVWQLSDDSHGSMEYSGWYFWEWSASSEILPTAHSYPSALRWIYSTAVGVCEDQFCVLRGSHVLPVHGQWRQIIKTTVDGGTCMCWCLCFQRTLGSALIFFVAYHVRCFLLQHPAISGIW